jgi:cell division protein FtsQ
VTRVGIDPRVAKRRQAVTRERGRRRLRVLVVLISVLAGIGAIVGVLQSPLLDVDRVEVIGAKETSVSAVLHATGLTNRGHAMIAVDRFALARRVERLPWVAHAEVTRKWPNVVRVAIVERVAIGAIAVPGGVALLDRTGRVLGTASAPPAGAISVVASDAIPAPGATAPEPVRSALGILNALSSNLAKQVQSIHRLDGTPPTYELGITGGVTIRLGEADQMTDKLSAAEAVLAQQHAPGTVIDVRVPASPTVTHTVIH